jgi:hypothetical protein
MKKVLSLVLVIAMVLSSMSFAFASTSFEDVAGNDYEDAINTLVALGVVTGYEDGTYRPEKVVTRAEMAKLMVITLGYGDLVAGSKSNFADTQGHWADAYIALAAGKGIVLGDGNGNFRPDATVSYDEAITMLVRALGYTDASNELKGMSWPTNFKVKATELDITDDVAIKASGADRGGVAQLIFNSLEAKLVTIDSDGDANVKFDSDNDPILLVSKLATKVDPYSVTTDKVDKNNDNFAGELVDLAPYMYQSVVAYVNDDDQVVYIQDTNSLVVEGVIDDVVESGTSTVVSVEEADGTIKKVTFANTSDDANIAADMFENGATRTVAKTFAQLLDTETISIVATDADKDGKIDASNIASSEVEGFVLTQQTRVAQVAKEYVEGKSKVDVFALPLEDDEVNFENVTVKGAVDSVEDIAEDDVVVEYKSEAQDDADDFVTTLVVSRDTVEGTVTRRYIDTVAPIDTTTNYYYVDGTKYYTNDFITTIFDIDDEGIFYLDHNGDIVAFDGDSAVTNYAVIAELADGSMTQRTYTGTTTTTKYTLDDYPLMKLATQENELVTFEVAVELKSTGAIDTTAKLNNAALLVADVAGLDVEFTATGMPQVGDVVKYSVDEDGRISKIKTVSQSLIVNGTETEDLVFASDAIIFNNDADRDYEVVDVDALDSKLENGDDLAIYNSNGEISVLLTDDVDSVSDATYAYVNTINEAADDTQVLTVYINGEKVEYTTTGDYTFTSKGVTAVTFDGEEIDGIGTITGTVATSTTATAVYASSGRIVFLNGTTEVGAYLAADATILTIEEDGTKVLSDIYDIDANESVIDVYMQDGRIAFVVIHE